MRLTPRASRRACKKQAADGETVAPNSLRRAAIFGALQAPPHAPGRPRTTGEGAAPLLHGCGAPRRIAWGALRRSFLREHHGQTGPLKLNARQVGGSMPVLSSSGEAHLKMGRAKSGENVAAG